MGRTDTKKESEAQGATSPKPVETKPAETGKAKKGPTVPFAPLPGRTSKAKTASLAELARETNTHSVVLAGLKQAYELRDDSRMTKADFVSLRDAWLAAPLKG